MAKISIPADAAERPTLPPGTYGADGTVVITRCEERDVPGANADDEQFLDISVLIPDAKGGVFAQTSPFRNHTRTTPNSGSKVIAFLKQLGIADPVNTEFDLDDLVNLPVVVEVAMNEWTDKETGETRRNNIIKNITRLA